MYCLSYFACRIFKKLFAKNSINHCFFPLIPDVHLSVSHNVQNKAFLDGNEFFLESEMDYTIKIDPENM